MTKAKRKTKPRKSKQQNEAAKLKQVASVLQTLSDFVEEAEYCRTGSAKSKELIRNICQTWAKGVLNDRKRQHQAFLIKGFADFLV